MTIEKWQTKNIRELPEESQTIHLTSGYEIKIESTQGKSHRFTIKQANRDSDAEPPYPNVVIQFNVIPHKKGSLLIVDDLRTYNGIEPFSSSLTLWATLNPDEEYLFDFAQNPKNPNQASIVFLMKRDGPDDNRRSVVVDSTKWRNIVEDLGLPWEIDLTQSIRRFITGYDLITKQPLTDTDIQTQPLVAKRKFPWNLLIHA